MSSTEKDEQTCDRPTNSPTHGRSGTCTMEDVFALRKLHHLGL